ncbi:MAG: hypothetical protein AAFR31_22230, partial [Cyanobacteria bacterium J06627_8]
VLDQLLSSYQSQYQDQMNATPNNPLINYLYRIRFEFETLRSLNDPRGVYSRIPVNYWID